MGTVLRVLVVFILILSGLALALAIMLFGRRELLIGRTHTLEEQFIKVAKTIEAADPADQVQPRYAAKDTSPVTSKELENPERSPFWESYQYKLETPNLPAIEIGTEEKRLQLRKYYQVGPDGKKVISALNNQPSTKGPGTMQELLDNVFDRAKVQNAVLNKTRAELAKLREELVTTIEDHNKLKTQGRADAKTIEVKEKEIADLKEKVRVLDRKIEGLEEEKRALTAEVAEAKNEVVKQKEAITGLENAIKDYKAEIMRLKGGPGGGTKTPTPLPPGVAIFDAILSPGEKGKLVSVDEAHKFVIVEMSSAFMDEVLGPARDRALPQLELMVKRPGMKSASGEFVTRIKLKQVIRDQNLVVADILIDWQQVPLEKGDVVFF